MILTGKLISLRAIEPEDLTFLYQSENDESLWAISHTQTPFSRFILKQYLENAHLDIFEAKQLRLIIEKKNTKEPIGMIDLFEYNPQHKRAGIGIFIHPDCQQKGFASESLKLLIEYCCKHLQMHQLYANVSEDNVKSIHLFTKHQFKKVGIKKDWNFINGSFTNEILFQFINE
jgi:diamine N-acetyltransferase